MAVHQFKRQENVPAQRWRILLNGAPAMWKTTALLSLPEVRGIVVSPGEKQHRVIPEDDPNTLAFRFTATKDSHEMVRDVERTSMEVITGKYGKINSFAFDGFHKYLMYIMDSITDGIWFGGEKDVDPRLYTLCYRKAESFLERISENNLPWVVVTCWDGDKPDRKAVQGEKPSDVPTHIRPGLMGQMSKIIMGEFPIILHAAKKKPDLTMQKRFGYPNDREVVMWQTRPYGEVHGCSIRGKKEVVEQIPTFIPASFQVLEELLTKAENGEKNG